MGLHVERHIVCVDCGGRCHLLSHEEPEEARGACERRRLDPGGAERRPSDHEGFQPGDIVAYRCEDCMDRWDLVLEDPEG